MAKPATALATASKRNMIGPQIAASFWAAVEDCLVRFHDFSRGAAAEKVVDTWRRLGNLTTAPEKTGEQNQTFDEMIYHAEPWYIACNLANHEIPIESNRTAYQHVLQKNGLGAGTPSFTPQV